MITLPDNGQTKNLLSHLSCFFSIHRLIPHTVHEHDSFVLYPLYGPTVKTIRDHWETIALTIQTFVSRVMSLLFNTLSRFVIAFLPRRNHLISWLYSSSSAQKEEICHYSTFSPALCHEVIGLNRASLVAQW